MHHCECKFCVRSRKWEFIEANGTVDELHDLIREIENDLADAEEDLSWQKFKRDEMKKERNAYE